MSKFVQWCKISSIDADAYPDLDLCNVLSVLVDSSLFGSSVCVFAHAISNHWARLHPVLQSATADRLVLSVLKGAKPATVKPPTLRAYWDISVVLAHIGERYDVDVSLAQLCCMTASILALVTSWRPRSDMGRISLSSLLFLNSNRTNYSAKEVNPNVEPVSVTFSAWLPKEGDRKDCFLSRFPSDNR
jgi:hypothetical protein